MMENLKKEWKTPGLKIYTLDSLTKEVLANASSYCGGSSGSCIGGTWCTGYGWYNGKR